MNELPIVFISYPYKDDVIGNVERVRLICEAVKDEVMPIAPHLFLPQYIDERTERELALTHCKRLIDICDEVWICSKVVTSGMIIERQYAKEQGIPVEEMAWRFDK